ncbi:uncharacterized protein FOMMEDRAFT_138282 [Fomitiporia mediterranea MF3/22]|uniref:uncharacterized protein n=1 Tax=Fomitiporia mediterranea (strain MF3/22) TaxID=694068 RepID=UPI00044081C9|nr:uncharacterized protein FOMMEDRAFT_138282 [Fomitiporia mediterranea MF3/22]EJD08512.1 hypothetical protein FOMMEDRAFT_138282 [Fomitiporia mediterranea MF3/22]
MTTRTVIPTPVCHDMAELPSASEERARLNQHLQEHSNVELDFNMPSPLAKHIVLGLAVTTGSAIGEQPPSEEDLLSSFEAQNSVGLSAGARAWTKHAHRSGCNTNTDSSQSGLESDSSSSSWWGNPKGPISALNDRALQLFDKIMQSATWRNLHWLPHEVLVYEVRVEEGYGMRWSQDRSTSGENVTRSDSSGSSREDAEEEEDQCRWVFRGFVEPMMENGHEVGWRH